MNLSPAPREWRQIVLITIGHVLLVFWALRLVTPEEGISLMWLPDGYLLGCLVLLPMRLWPALLAVVATSTLGVELATTERPLTMALGFLVANLLESVGGAWLVLRFAGGRAGFSNFAELGYFLLLCVLLLPAVSASIGAASVVTHTPVTDFFTVYRTWHSSAGLGILFVAPLIITGAVWLDDGRLKQQLRHPWLMLALLSMLAIVTASSAMNVHSPESGMVIVFLGLPLLCWAAIQFGLLGGIAIGAVLVVSSVQLTALGVGPFSGRDTTAAEAVFQLQSYLGASIIASLFTSLAVDRLKKTSGALVETGSRFQALFDHSPISLWEQDFSTVKAYLTELRRRGMTDASSWLRAHPEDVVACAQRVKILGVNDRTLSMFGAQDRAALLSGLEQVFDDDALHIFREEIVALDRGEREFRAEAPQKRLDGERFHTITGVAVVPGHEQDWKRVVVSVEDISDMHRARQRLRESAAVFANTSEGVTITDLEARILDVNDAFVTITGYSRDEVIGSNPRILQSGRHDQAYFAAMWRSLEETGNWRGEIWNRRKNGSIYPQQLTISVVNDSAGRPQGYVGVFNDLSALKRSEQKLEHLAHHDPLTELPNRLLFNARLEQGILHARRRQTMLAVAVVAIDGFKHVNDSLGHPMGDELLKALAERLTGCIRKDDTVARTSGNEFAVLLEEIGSADHAAMLVRKIIVSINGAFDLEGNEVHVTASVGLSLFPNDGDDAISLLRNADTAMNRAKEEGRNTYQFYTTELTSAAFEHLFLENALRMALPKNEFHLVYQPQVDLDTGELIGLEALLRWHHPDQGVIPPARFIPVAEQSGLIWDIGAWVLRTACSQARIWRDAGLDFGRIAVNISGPQVAREQFQNLVQDELALAGLPADCLALEVTESFVMRKADAGSYQLENLRRAGIEIAIDDFGTGYSSLSYLKQLPIDKLKIDQSFVRDIPQGADDMAIAETIISIGRALGMSVIAEGVETEEQAAFLRAHGCRLAQGYLFSEPLPPEKLDTALIERLRRD